METRPKNQTSNKKQQRAFSFPFSFICFNSDLWKVVDIKSNEKPERVNNEKPKATKSSKKQRRATESNEEQQKAKRDNGAGKTKTGNKRHKKVQMETRLKHQRILSPNVPLTQFFLRSFVATLKTIG